MPSTNSNAVPREGTLAIPLNQNVTDNRSNKAVQSALRVIERNYDTKNKQDSNNNLIQNLFEGGFEVRSPDGSRKINSKLLQQALWKLMARTKPLDFMIHGNNRPEDMEKIVTAGVSTILDEGGFLSSFRDKNGVAFKMYMWGDGFMQVGANPEDNPAKPVLFSPISNSNIYTDVYATGVRLGGDGASVSEMVVVKSMSWDDAVKEYPAIKKKAGVGEIPRYLGWEKELERDYEQTYKTYDDKVEIGYYYNISQKYYLVFVGPACTIIDEKKGDKYPFVMEGTPYIPVLQFMCQPSSEGFYNHGIGDMLYDLALMTQRLMNQALGHIEDNTYPIQLINVPKGEAGKFFNKLRMAHEMRAAGKKGYVAMEYDVDNPNSGRVNSEALLTNSLFQEWDVMFAKLEKEIVRLGVNLDEMERDPNATATSIIAEEETANSFVRQVQEYNASESKFAVDLTMDFIRKFVPTEDNTPINSTTKITIEGMEDEVRMDQVTMGAVADELRKSSYFSIINARSGVLPSGTLQRAKLTSAMAYVSPGTPAFTKLQLQLLKLDDIDVTGEELGMAPEQGQEPGQQAGQPPEQIQTEPKVPGFGQREPKMV